MRAVFLDYATVSRGDLDLSRLRAALPDLTLHEVTTANQISGRIDGFDVVLTNKLPLTRERIAAATRLRAIGLIATGTNNVDLDAARDHEVRVCNIRDYCSPSVAQHVLGVLLALTHRFSDYAKLATGGEWSRSPQFTMLNYPIRELHGRVLGVVGWGALGQAVAGICERALGMRVRIANRPGGERREGRIDLDTLLGEADVLTLHCPLTPATEGLIGAAQLARMKRDAILINTARGGLVDTQALADALRAGHLGGAAIDVLPEEPPVSGSPLFAPDLPNLILTPHTAWAARESRQRALDELAANVADLLQGGSRGRVV